MKLLIIGGTVFVGRHLVESAQARGHEVTLFNRGQYNADLFPNVEKLRGNRDGELDALRGRTWDAVIDTCGYVPRIVKASVKLLADAVRHYTFISTISVYADFSQSQIDEDGPLGTLENTNEENVTGETYGPLKVLCEAEAERAFAGRCLIVRPGLIVGPHDPTDRFTSWPVRVARGGEVLAVGPPETPTQFIDARDLADWTIRLIEAKTTGIYNATGPEQTLPFADLLNESKAVSGSDATFTFVAAAFLEAQGLEEGALYSWAVGDDPKWANVWNVSNHRAVENGLTFRPLVDTIRDTLVWNVTRPVDKPIRFVLDPDRERDLLAAWHKENG